MSRLTLGAERRTCNSEAWVSIDIGGAGLTSGRDGLYQLSQSVTSTLNILALTCIDGAASRAGADGRNGIAAAR